MPAHATRFPGTTNDPNMLPLTARRAKRLTTIAGLRVTEHVDKPVVAQIRNTFGRQRFAGQRLVAHEVDAFAQPEPHQ